MRATIPTSETAINQTTTDSRSAIRVLLVDDHQLVRSCLRGMLEREEGLEIVGEAGDGREAIELAAKLRPHVVLMDVAMPNLNGMEATRLILREGRHSRVIALSMYQDPGHVQGMIRAGAMGYLLKTCSLTELVTAIRIVAAGKMYLMPDVTNHVVTEYGSPGNGGTSPELTQREREVLQLVAEGHSTKSIANHLNVSTKTVESHRQRMAQKLGLHSTAELTRYALQEGITAFEV
jgi:DNA-binding NarL/FixJ family response regulator